MKNAVTAIQGETSPKHVWTGAELLSRSPRPPVGFYKNTDTSYHGLIFVDQAHRTCQSNWWKEAQEKSHKKG